MREISNKIYREKLTASKLAKITGYSKERIRQLKLILSPYVLVDLSTNKYNRIIYTQDAIKFLNDRRGVNLKIDKIIENLFRTGDGRETERLVMEFDTKLEGPGWCKLAAKDILQEQLKGNKK